MSEQQFQLMRSPEEYTVMMEKVQEQNKQFIRDFKVQEVQDQRKCEALFGEVFMTSNETNGGLEMLSYFKGKLISSLGGGQMKLFVIENKKDGEGVISSLHAPEYDEYDYTFTEREELEGKIVKPEQLASAFSSKGKLKHIIAGKKHMLFLTDQGTVFSWGYGEYGSLGLGGVLQSTIPRQLNNLQKMKVNQIACGEYHSMVLTDTHDLYIWGKGFEGQLGMGEHKTTLSSPKYHTFFNQPPADQHCIRRLKKQQRIQYKNYVVTIAAGAQHSLCINYQGKLYAWGDNTMGQIGIGNTSTQFHPVQVSLDQSYLNNHLTKTNTNQNTNDNNTHDNNTNENNTNDNVIIKNTNENKIKENNNNNNSNINGNEQEDEGKQVVSVKGGYGHTVCLNKKGEVFSWGLNCYGQLGHGDNKTMKRPVQVTRDTLTNLLPTMNKISCGYYNTFAICSQGRLYSWGGGNLGQKDEKNQKAPRKIEAHTEGRIFTDVFCNATSTLFFAKARIISIRPESGPSSGNTMLSLVGTGFTNTGNQKVRFTFMAKKLNVYKRTGNTRLLKQQSGIKNNSNNNNNQMQVGGNEESCKKIEVEVKCDFDPVTDCYHCFTPNFQEQWEESLEWPVYCTVELTLDGQTYIQYANHFLIYSAKLQTQNIYPKCANIQGGTQLTLVIPNMDTNTAAHLSNLTVGFQAKQFRGKQENNKENKDNSYQSGEDGSLKESSNTRPTSTRQPKGAVNPLAVGPEDQELEKENWTCVAGNYSNGKITCLVPQMLHQQADSLQFNVDVALNGQQFSGQPSSFRFYNIQVEKIEPNCGAFEGGLNISITGQGFFDTISKQIMFKSCLGERIIDLDWDKGGKSYHFIQPPLNWLLAGHTPTQSLFQQVLADHITLHFSLNGVEWLNIGNFYYRELTVERIGHVDEKISQELFEKEEELVERSAEDQAKFVEQDNYECQTLFKKTGSKLYIYGSTFENLPSLTARFKLNDQVVQAPAVFKNSKQLGVVVPELTDVTSGIQNVELEVSLNGIQYSRQAKTFRMMVFEKGMTQDQKNKFEDAELKTHKKKK